MSSLFLQHLRKSQTTNIAVIYANVHMRTYHYTILATIFYSYPSLNFDGLYFS